MTFTVLKGKVVIKLGKHQCTMAAVKAIKAGLDLLDAGKRAAKKARQVHEYK